MDPLLKENLITTKDASEFSGYTPDYLSRLIRSGKIIGKRVGHSWLIERQSLDSFLGAQGNHKIDRARVLASERAREYRAHRSLLRRATKTLTAQFSVSEGSGLSRASLRSHGFAVAAALVVVTCGAFAAQASAIPQLGTNALMAMQEAAVGFDAAFGSIPERIAENISRADIAMRMQPANIAQRAADATAHIAFEAVDFSSARLPSFETAPAPTLPVLVMKDSTSAPIVTGGDLQTYVAGAVGFFASPLLMKDVVANAYADIGANAYSLIGAAFGAYDSLIEALGVRMLAAGTATRDTLATAPAHVAGMNLAFGQAIIDVTHAAIRAQVSIAYGTAAAAPASARVSVALIGGSGDFIARVTSHVPALATNVFLRATEVPATLAPAIAQAVFDAEYRVALRFVPLTHSVARQYLAFVEGAGQVAYASTDMMQRAGHAGLAFAAQSVSAVPNMPAELQDAYLGAVGRGALALENIAKVPSVAAVLVAIQPVLNPGEALALGIYESIHGFFSSTTNALATLLLPPPVIVMPNIPAPLPVVTATTSVRALALQPVNSFPTYTTVVQGVSADVVNQSIGAMRTDILGTVAGMIQPVVSQGVTNLTTIQQVNMIQDLSNLIVRNGDFRGGTFSGGTVSGANSVSATTGSFTNLNADTSTFGVTTVSGTLTVNGVPITGSSSGNVSTSSAEVAGNLPYWTSTAGTPAALGSAANLNWNNLTSLLSIVGNASTSQLTATSSVYLATTGGNVGVGTTSPSSKFSVQGDALFSGNISAANLTATGTLSAGGLATFANASTTNLSVSNNFWIGGNATTTSNGNFTTNGLVGIGQSNPTYNLDVTGNARFTSFVDAANFVATSSSIASIFRGGILVNNGTSTITNLVTVNATSTNATSTNLFSSSFVATNATSTSLAVTNLSAGRIPFITTGGALIDSGNFLWNTLTNLLTITGNASTTQFTTTGSTYLATTGGSVGVGTTTPGALFSVHGNGLFSGNLFAANLTATGTASIGGALSAASASFSSALPVTSGGTGVSSFTPNALLYSNAAGTALAFAATSTLNIGGNAGTATQLQTPRSINGISFNGTADIIITAASSTLLANNNTWSGVNVFANASSSNFSVANNFWVGGNATTTSTGNFSTSGSIGIGTTSPSTNFGIVGSQYLTGGLGIGVLNTTSGSLKTTGTATVGSDLLIQTLLNCNSASSAIQSDGSGKLVCGTVTAIGGTSAGGWTSLAPNKVQLATTTDLVGIGISPGLSAAKLTVSSGGAATTTLSLNAVSGQTANIFEVYDNALNLFSVITPSGSLGIGTTTPAARFSVQGNGLFSGNLSAANITATGTLSANSLALTTALPVTSGGTGVSSFTGSQILYTNAAGTAIISTATSTLNIGGTAANVTGTVAVANGGTGTTTAPVSQLLYGGSGGVYQSVATSTISAGNGLTNTSGTFGYQVGGTNVSIGLAAINANSVLANNTSGSAVPSAVATSTFFGTPTAGTILAFLNGQNTYVATTTYSSGLSYVSGNVTNTGVLSIGPTAQTITGAVTIATSSTPFNGLTASTTITGSGQNLTFTNTLAGILGVAGGGTGQSSLSSSALLYGAGTGAVQSVGTTTLTGNNGLTLSAGNGYFVGGSNATIGLATINAGVLGAVTNGAVPTSQATSTLYGVGTGGQILAFNNGALQFVATTTFSSGLAYASGNVTNTGLLSLQQLGGGTAQTGAITFATSSQTTNGQTVGLNITNSSGAFTFAPTISGTLTVAGGGTGQSSLSSSQLIYGAGTGAVQSVATTSLSLGTGLSYSGTLGSFVGGASGSLTIATSSLYSGTTGQFPYFSGTNTLTATSSLFLATSGNIGIGSTSPWAQLSINPNGITGPAFAVGSSTATKFLITNGGLVGIGTTSPSQALSVTGTIYTTTGVQFPDGSVQTAAAASSNAGLTGQVGYYAADGTSLSGTSTIFIATNQNVGIGTTSPSQALSVTGRIYTTTGIQFPDGSLQTAAAVSAAAGLAGQAAFYATNGSTLSGTSTIFIATNQNVGIGTTTPGTLFSVHGNGLFSGNVSLANLTATGTITALGLATFGNASTTNLSVASNLWVGGNATTSSNGNFATNGTLSVAGLATLANASTTNLSVSNNLWIGGNATTSSNGNFTTNGSVGIGTTSPWAQLSINPNGITGPAFAVGSSTATNFVVANSGYVGIGTSSPAYSFSVNQATSTNLANAIAAFTGSGGVGTWRTTTSLATGVLRHTAVVANGYVYVIGGAVGAVAQTNVQFAKLNADGTVGSWASTTPLATAQSLHTSVVANGYVYAIGGSSSGNAVVQYAKLNANGTLSSWQATTPLATGQNSHASVYANGFIYVIGGVNNQNLVQYAKVNADGSIGAWQTASSLPTLGAFNLTSVVANGYVYALGGNDGTVATSTVTYAKLNADGTLGTWANTTAMGIAAQSLTAVVANGYVYAIGGATNQNTIQYAKLNNDGTLGSWQFATALSTGEDSTAAVVANGYVYVLGGNATPKTVVQFAPLQRVLINGNLDLIGLTGGTLGDVNTNGSQGSTAGSIFSGNIFSNGTLEVLGNSMLQGGLGVNGPFTLNATTSLSQNSSIFSLNNATGTAPILSALYNGNVGIGTTTPGALFSVHGNGLFSGNISAANLTATGTASFGTTTVTNLIVTNTSTSTFAGGITAGKSIGIPLGTVSFPGLRFNVAGGAGIYSADGSSLSISAGSNIQRVLVDSNGVGIGDGTVGNPSLHFISDLSTGIWRSGASTLNFSTGGFERVRIDSTGNVGIGSTTPWAQLSINPNGITGPAFAIGSSTATNFIVTNGGNVGIGTSNPTSALTIGSGVSGSQILVNYPLSGSSATPQYSFINRAASGLNYFNDDEALELVRTGGTILRMPANVFDFQIGSISQMRLTATGLGIGTTSPFARLSVAGAGVGTGYAFAVSDIASTTRFVIQDNGNVGIGTTTPSQALSVHGNGLFSGNISAANIIATGTLTAALTAFTNASTSNLSISNNLWVGGNATTTSNGNFTTNGSIGIGTTTPFGILSLVTPDTLVEPTISIRQTNAFNYGFDIDEEQQSVGRLDFYGVQNGGRTQVMSLLRSGAGVGIGTIAPASQLDVSNASGGVITVSRNDTAVVLGDVVGGMNFWGNDSDLVTQKLYAKIEAQVATPGNGQTDAAVGNLLFYTTGTTVGGSPIERLRIDSSGNVGIGTTSPWGKLSLNNSTNDTAGQPLLVVASSTANSTTTQFIITNTGFVGIGTSSPTYNFTVNQATSTSPANAIAAFTGSGGVGSWRTTTSLATAVLSHSAVVANGYVYVIGGSVGGVAKTNVQYAKLNADGTVGSWASTTPLATAEKSHTSVVANGYVYTIGGSTAGNDAVQYAKINANGQLGSWQTTTVLGTGQNSHATVAANGFIYVLGGVNNQNVVQYAKLNADGTVGAWQTTTSLPTLGAFNHSAVVANGYVYSIGGNDGIVATTTVVYAKVNTDGTLGSWLTASALALATQTHTSVVANGYIYVLGGASNQGTVQFAKLNNDGTLGVWQFATALTTGQDSFASVVANGYVYALGGNSATHNVVQFAPLQRVLVNGNLDLLGLAGGTLGDANTNGSQGSTGGSIFAGNIFSNGTLEVLGNAMLQGGLGVNGPFTLNASTTLAQNASIFSLNNATGTAPILSALYNGNVGIGTTTPGSLFSVQGNGLFAGTLTANNIIATGTMSFGTTTLTNLAVSNFSTSTFVGGLTVGTSQFVVQQSTGRVGIGTASPLQKLHISGGDLQMDNNRNIRFRNAAGNNDAGLTLTTSDSLEYTSPSGSSAAFSITTGGNVGIGTTTPSQALSVQGNGLFSGNISAANITATGTLSAATLSFTNASSTNLSVSNNLWVGGNATTTSNGNFTTNGTVGIGSTTPWAQLSINPNGITGPAFAIGSSTKTNFVVTNGGNVGIGTAAPSAMLHIAGTLIIGTTTSVKSTDNAVIPTFYLATSSPATSSVGGGVMALDSVMYPNFSSDSTATFFGARGKVINIATANHIGASHTVGVLGSTEMNAPGTTQALTFGLEGKVEVIAGTLTAAQSVHASLADVAAGQTLGSWTGILSKINDMNGTLTSGFGYDFSVNSFSGSPITTLVAYRAADVSTSLATTYSAFKSAVNSGTNRLGLDISGTADNEIVGNVRIGSTVAPTVALDVTGNMIVSGNSTTTNATSTSFFATVASSTFLSSGTATVSGTLTVGSTVTSQTGFSGPLVRGGTGATSALQLRSTGGVGTSDAIVFQVGNNGATEAARIITSGLFGVGTTTPLARFDIAGTLGSQGDLFNISSTTATNVVSSLFRVQANGNVGIGSTTPWAQLSINPNGITGPAFAIGSTTSTSFVVTNGGNVGIGTTTPSTAKLTIGGLLNSGGAGVTGTSTQLLTYFDGSGGNSRVFTGLETAPTLTSGGNINTIYGLYASPTILAGGGVQNTSYGVYSVPTINNSGSVSNTVVGLYSNPQFTNGGTAGSAYPAILLGGNVGIGTTSPYARLSVAGEVVAGLYTATTTGFRGPTGSTLTPTYSFNDDTDTGIFGFTSGFAFSVNNSEKARFNINGLRLAAGTAADPALADTSSGSHGLYFPSNALGFSTSNLERMRIDSAGNLGIGSTTPWAQLSINPNGITGPAFAIGSTTGTSFVVTNGGRVAVGTSDTTLLNVNSRLLIDNGANSNYLRLTTSGSSVLQGLELIENTTTKTLIVRNNIASNPRLSFYVGDGSTEDAVIQDNGNFGIGTTTPNWKLQIAGTRSSLALSDTSAGANQKHWLFSSMGGNLYIGTSTDLFATTTQSALTILNNGNFGIGTSTPGALFAIGSGLANGGLYFNATGLGIGTSSPFQALSVVGNTRLKTTTNSATAFVVENAQASTTFAVSTLDSASNIFSVGSSTGASYLEITSGGNVGIGTTTPNWNLQIAGAAPLLALTDLSAAANAKHWLIQSSGGNFKIGTSSDTFGTPTTYFTIANTGNVGIGTTSPFARLSVAGAGSGTGYAFAVSDIASTTRFVIQDNGNVGIGTTSPYATLSISASSTKPAFALVQSTSTTATGALMSFLSNTYATSTGASTTPQEFGNLRDFHMIVKGSLSDSTNLGGIPGEVVVSGRYAYVTTNTNPSILAIVDVSNPASPVAVGTTTSLGGNGAGRVNGVAVAGHYAYVAIGTNGTQSALTTVDVSNPKSPQIIGATGLGGTGNICIIQVAGRYAYVICDTGNLKIVDISNPASPTIVSSFTTSNVISIYVSGNYVYLTKWDTNALLILDVSNPTNPLLTATLSDANLLNRAAGVYVSGRYAYVANSQSNSLTIVDVSNPSSPVIVGSVADSASLSVGLGTGAHIINVSGRYAYVISQNNARLTVIDISSPSNPVIVGSFSDGTNLSSPRSLFIVGRYAYIAAANRLTIVDLAGLDVPNALIGNLQSSSITAWDNIDVGNNLYVRGSANLGSGGLYSNGSGSFVQSTTTSLLNSPTLSAGTFDSNTSSNVDVLTITHGGAATTSPGANGISAGLLFAAGNTSATTTNIGRIAAIFTSAGGTATTSALTFSTLSGFALNEAMRIDSTGNVGIGTTTPSNKLSIDGGSLAVRGTGSYTQYILQPVSGSTETWLIRNQASNNDFQITPFTTGADTPALTIKNTGKVGIGTTSPALTLSVSTSIAADAITWSNAAASNKTGYLRSSSGNVSIANAPAGGNEALILDRANIKALITVAGATVVDFNANGISITGSGGTCTMTGAASGGTCFSDAQLKDVQSNITGVLDGFDSLNLKTFYWNDLGRSVNHASTTILNRGFIAQDVEQVFPELVSTDASGYKSLDYGSLSLYAIEAIKELNARTKFIQNAATSTVLTVDVAGNIGIGTTTPNHTLSVAGDIGAIAFVNTSTGSAKTDINYLNASSTEDTLNQLVHLKVATYRYKIEDQSDPLRIGLIAEDTQTIAPEILSPDGKGVDIYKLATFTLAGVQALAAKMAVQETRITSLEDRINALESGAISTASGSPFTLGSSTLASALESFGVFIQKGIAQFNTLVFRQLVASKDADGTSSAGSVTILTGNTVAQVNNSLVKATTKVFVTFNSQIAGSWWVSDKTNGSFRVILSAPQATDVSFDYFLVQTEGQIATSTPANLDASRPSGPSVTQGNGSTDFTPPVITLLGDNPLHISVDGIFTDPGVSVSDAVDGIDPYTTFINGIEQEVSTATIDTSSPTTYLITYRAMDVAGNVSTAIRSVIIGNPDGTVSTGSGSTGSTATSTSPSVDTVAPVVTLVGDAAMQITVGDTFSDPGATATDDTDGDLTTQVAISGTVDATTAGLYTIVYTATDAADNSSSVSRVVTVAAPAAGAATVTPSTP